MALATVLVALGVATRKAAAQEEWGAAEIKRAAQREIPGGLQACAAIRVTRATPVMTEWAYWVSTGASLEQTPARLTVRPMAAVGAEVTYEVAAYSGFPSAFPASFGMPMTPARRRRGFFSVVRLGPWVSAATRAPAPSWRAALFSRWTARG